MKKKIMMISISVLFSLLLASCTKQKTTMYHVDYGNSKSMFTGAKDAYPAGEKVTLYYEAIATDTDYAFYLDGESLNYSYDEKTGIVITFTMPNHDVALTYTMKNSMEYVPDTEDETIDAAKDEEKDATEETSEDEKANDLGTTQEASEDESQASTDESKQEGNDSQDMDLKEYVSVSYLDEPHVNIETFDFVTVSDSEPIESLVFETEETVTEFKVLQLSFKDVDENGKPLFLYEELYSQEKLTKEHPLCASVTFLGDTPNVGITYKDPAGNERFYAIEISGYDGSLMMTEF